MPLLISNRCQLFLNSALASDDLLVVKPLAKAREQEW